MSSDLGMPELADRVAVVTGAGSGIGRALAVRLGQERMTVVLADVEAAALEEAAAAVRETGAEAIAVVTDVTDPEAVERLAATSFERFGAVHLVCNNAGVGGHLGRVWETAPADWRWVLEVNVLGVVNGIRAFTPRLISQGGGYIVNTSAVVAWTVFPAWAPYAASKHALLAISEGLRNELRASGAPIGVSVFCPGPVKSRIVESHRNWPAALGEEPERPRDEMSTTMYEHMVAVAGQTGIEPEQAAATVIDGVREGRFLIVTHPQVIVDSAERRLDLARTGLVEAQAPVATVPGAPGD